MNFGYLYSLSLTFSIQLAVLPSSCSWIAICVIAVVAVVPCQCFSLGGIQTTSPGWFFWTWLSSHLCTKSQLAITNRVCPSGWVCHGVRAPGSNVTLAPTARAGSFAWNNGSIRTLPVKYSSDHLVEGCEPILLISNLFSLSDLQRRHVYYKAIFFITFEHAFVCFIDVLNFD